MKNKLLLIILICIIYTTEFSTSALASIINISTSTDYVNTYYVDTYEENQLVLNMIKSNMETDANIIYSGEMLSYSNSYLDEAIKTNYSPQNNVINASYGTGSYYSYSLYQDENSNKTITAKYHISYMVDKDQTDYVYKAIRAAIRDNISELKTEYDKAYWAYKWILDNVHYDETLTYYSAYDGLQSTGTVCSGYATLYCAFASELGLECSFVSGTDGKNDEGSHAWNIIKLDSKWYCIDTTWGDGGYEDKYFLKSKDTFASPDYGYHKSKLYDYYINNGEVFSTTDYINTNYSKEDAVLPSVYNIEMDILKNNIMDIDESYTFMLNNQDNVPIKFTSTDSNIAKVDKNGLVTGLKEGTVTITAYNTELNIEQTCEITVKKLSNNSPTLSKQRIVMNVGRASSIKILNQIDGSKINFKSSNPSVALVNANGKIITKKTGKCKIICTLINGTSIYTFKCDIVVK